MFISSQFNHYTLNVNATIFIRSCPGFCLWRLIRTTVFFHDSCFHIHNMYSVYIFCFRFSHRIFTKQPPPPSSGLVPLRDTFSPKLSPFAHAPDSAAASATVINTRRPPHRDSQHPPPLPPC